MARKIGIVSAMTALVVALFALPASAACHVAHFNPPSTTVNESDGTATLRLELHGDAPGCRGAVKYETRNGSAHAGTDYTSKSAIICLSTAGAGPRGVDVEIPILNDNVPEGDEKFTVELSKVTQPECAETPNFGVGGPATVNIKDDDEAPAPDPDPEPEPPAQEEGEQEAEESPEASPSPTEADEEQEATPDDGGSPSPGGPLTFGEEGTNGEDDGGIPTAGVVGIVGLLIAAAAGVGLWFVNRRKASEEA